MKYWEVFASDCTINLFDQIIDNFYGAFMTFEDFKKESNLMCYEFTIWQPERGMKYWNTNEWADCLEDTYKRGLKETKKVNRGTW